jgi:hypothetical protein
MTLLYAACEWTFAAKISGCSIFDKQRETERAEFRSFAAAVSRDVSDECTSGKTDTFLFGDEDVVLPFVVNQLSQTSGCVIIRETVVTPFAPKDMANCSALRIVEFHLPDLPARRVPPRDLGLVVSQWTSENNGFSFVTYRSRDCAGPKPGA